MEPARIERRIGVTSSSDAAWAVISDLKFWDRWNPVETGVEGAITFGGSLSLTETIEGVGQRIVTGRVTQWQPRAQLVWAEARGLWLRSIRYFEIDELGPENCIVSNGFIFDGLRGEMYFDKHRKHLRGAVDAVSEGWKAAAESQAPSSPVAGPASAY